MSDNHNHENEQSTDIVVNSEPEKATLEALTLYMKSWNNRDTAGMDAAFHFPHARIASGQISILEKDRVRSQSFLSRLLIIPVGTIASGTIEEQFRVRKIKYISLCNSRGTARMELQ